MKKCIYAADDEANIRDLIRAFLEDAGYDVHVFETGDALFEAFQENPCDLALLDIMMPGSDGLTICRNLRAISTVPIIILTAKESEMDYAMGIHCGGDDYLTKPFRPSILSMRIKALLRRVDMERQGSAAHDTVHHEVITVGDLTYLPEERIIRCQNTELPLSMTEFALLSYLMRRANRPVSRDELLNDVWGFTAEVETRVADETVRRVRKKMALSDCRTQIRTEWGYGYRLMVGEEEPS